MNIRTNKLDKIFGSAASSAGTFILFAGIISTYNSLFSLILVPIGGFIAFTNTSSIIDFDNKRIRFSTNIFGFIKTGKWVYIVSTMKLKLIKSNKRQRTYSRSNRVLDISNKDFRIILCDENNKKIIPIQKFESLKKAKEEIENLSKSLKLSIL